MVRSAVGGAVLAMAMVGLFAARAHDDAVGRGAIVAELFTSEGCSSCPPADRLLLQLAAESPVKGVEVIGLEEHVDYWDRLGWRDPFSSAAFTNRQSEYAARVFRTAQIYTPQLVVDGAFEAVGSDRGRVVAAIAAAAARPGADLRVRTTSDFAQVHVDIDVNVPATVARNGLADVIVVLAERDSTIRVERGENSGRTLTHAAVVRTMMSVGVLPVEATVRSISGNVPVPAGSVASHLQVVAFVQEHESRRILAAARATSGTQ